MPGDRIMSRTFINLPCTVFLVLTLLVGFTSTTHSQDDLDAASAAEQLQALLESATEQLQTGEFEAALNSLNQIVQAGGGYSPAPLLLRAKTFAGLEEYEPAMEDLKNAETYAQATPQLIPEIKNTRAEIYMELEAYQLALPDLQAAVKLARGAPKLHFNYGKTLVKLGLADQAEKELTRFIESPLAEEDEVMRAEALSLRGQARGALNMDEEAFQDFADSLAIDDANYEAYFGRAALYMGEKDFEATAKDLRVAIENYTPPEGQEDIPFIQGYLLLASAYEEIGKEAVSEDQAQAAYMSSIEVCNEVLELLPEDDPNMEPARGASFFRRGISERFLGDYTRAVKSLSQALQYNPGLGEGYFRRGICFHYLGEEKLAIRDFEQAASIDFDSPRSNLWKGMAWAKLGDYNEAIRAYGESIAVSDRYIPAYVNRSLAHIQQGDYLKAVADLNEAIRLQPTEATHYYRRGKAYALAGESERAIQSYMSALEYDPRLGSAYLALAEELRETGRSELANEYLRRAEEL